MGAKKEVLKLLMRDLLTVLVLLALGVLACFAYTSYWPPFLVVESGSMMHGPDSSIGVIDTGDIVLLRQTSRIVTYVEGRATGYSTYGDYGDVIVFRNPELPYVATPIIHRPLFYVKPNVTGSCGASGCYDVPELNLTDVDRVTIPDAGYRRDFNLTVILWQIVVGAPTEGYITMGDANLYAARSFAHDRWIVPMKYVLGVARGEDPGGGILLLDSGIDIPPSSWLTAIIIKMIVIGIPVGLELYLWRWNILALFRRVG